MHSTTCLKLEGYNLRPLDIYLASFGPALEVISNSWPIRRELANPQRSGDPFAVTPNDALQVARREVFAARRRRISNLWANNPGDPHHRILYSVPRQRRFRYNPL